MCGQEIKQNSERRHLGHVWTVGFADCQVLSIVWQERTSLGCGISPAVCFMPTMISAREGRLPKASLPGEKQPVSSFYSI